MIAWIYNITHYNTKFNLDDGNRVLFTMLLILAFDFAWACVALLF